MAKNTNDPASGSKQSKDGTISVEKNSTGDFYDVSVAFGGAQHTIARLPAGSVEQDIAAAKQTG